ncbi:Chromosome segregation protein Spo0J, containings ParB-like nuclease domain (plasmid) [Nostoc flagelliforme CCNUN1]|uniref:Chromosome segregation protein Spo0J, containings ParB-like nuclease domain n=1 Tax=Nostoc flagelliforme CCNUN1 TaxID=2038116 RepID=A0A2K8T9R2_9NOSO|nr:hypothetical protein [Nostoc flagelliforme]AUB44447.1 Chromosome segregation protein Spo0J, containings ParB-like nuclease domain [Nostoc flagelliforme CCNUN1]
MPKRVVEYTKARALAQIQKLDEHVEFLEQGIANNWSLSEIRQRISEKKAAASTENTESNNYKERFTAAATKLKNRAFGAILWLGQGSNASTD